MEYNSELTQEQILDKLLGAEEVVPEKTVGIARIGLTVTLKALRDDVLETLEKRYTKTTRSKGVESKEFDRNRYYRALIDKATTAIGGNPSVKWGDQKLREKFKAADGEHVIKRLLLSGEIMMLVDVVLDLSGHYDKAEEIDDLKNESENED
jgi:hypothetical protein